MINNEINVNVVTVSFSESMCTQTKSQNETATIITLFGVKRTYEKRARKSKKQSIYSGDTIFAFYSWLWSHRSSLRLQYTRCENGIHSLAAHIHSRSSRICYLFQFENLYKTFCRCNGLLFEAFSLLSSTTFTYCFTLSTYCLLRNE